MSEIVTIKSLMESGSNSRHEPNNNRRKKLGDTCLSKYLERIHKCYALLDMKMNTRIWSTSSMKKRLFYLFRIILIILLFLDSIRIFAFLPVVHSKYLVPVVIFYYLIIGETLVSLSIIIDRMWKVDICINIIKKFNNFTLLECDSKCIEKIYKQSTYKQYICIIFFISFNFAMSILQPAKGEKNILIEIYVYPLPPETKYAIPLLLLRFWIHMIHVFPYYIHISAINVMQSIILREGNILIKHFEENGLMENMMPKTHSVHLVQLFEHFQELCSLINVANVFTQTQTFFDIIFSGICICCLIYGAIIRATSSPEYGSIMILSIFNGMHFAYIFQRGIHVYQLVCLKI